MKIKIILIIILTFLVVLSSVALTIDSGESNITSLRIAGDWKHPPYEYVDDNGIYKGFNVDIIRAISIETGIDIELIPMEWQDALAALQNGEVDAIQGISWSSEREKVYTFLEPTVTNSQVIFVNKDTSYITEIDDLSNNRVSFQVGDINYETIIKMIDIKMVPRGNQQQALEALLNGEADAFIGNRLTGLYYLQKKKNLSEVKIVGEPMFASDYGPAVLKGNTEAADILNTGINSIKRSGAYEKIYQKWFGEKFIDYSATIRKYIYAFIVFSLIVWAIILQVMFYNKKLKIQVSKRTKELEDLNNELMIHQARIYNLAYYDTVTNLPNRIFLIDHLKKSINEAKEKEEKLAVLFLDLDRFKQINDTLGHDIGDKILRLSGARLKRLLRKQDIISRMGGDEFLIVLHNIQNLQYIDNIAKKIISEMKKPFHISGYELYITTSIGISIYPYGGKDFMSLIKNSDIAMYRAKAIGGNDYQFYNKDFNSEGFTNLKIATNLRHAIDNNELLVYYQPKIQVSSGKLVGMEALLRWQNPELGFITPDRFIPIAEETGLILSIGEWVLRTACIQNKKWLDLGYDPIRVSVNISAKQFQHQNIVEIVARTLKETGLDPSLLELEITETIVIMDMVHTIEVLKELKRIGVYIAIDDFGIGYSSLNYLKEMSIDELKIDKSFIRELSSNNKNMAIANTIILLAHNLNLQVTAEGVETLGQLKFLEANYCDKVQGYYFSPPVPAESAEEFLKKEY